MASALQSAAGPRFLLPKISQRLTSVRPVSSAALSHTSNHTLETESSRPIHPRYHARRTFASSSASFRSIQQSRKAINDSLGQSAALRRQFSITAIRGRDHHFDTLKFVQRLKDEGFTEEQGVAMMKVLSDVIEERYAQASNHSSQRWQS